MSKDVKLVKANGLPWQATEWGEHSIKVDVFETGGLQEPINAEDWCLIE